MIHSMWKFFLGLMVGLGVVLLAACGQNSPDAEQTSNVTPAEDKKVVVFSARKQHLIEPLFTAFTKETGIKIEYITDNAQPLIARLVAAKNRPAADVFMAVDAGSLWFAAQQGILDPINSDILTNAVPKALRDESGQWFGLSQRARTIVYSTERVQPSELSTYADLASSKWKGRLCLRTSQKIYNQSLIAMMLEASPVPEVEKMVARWVRNLAAPVFSSDTLLVQAIASGQCDVGIVNTYYLGQELAQNSDLPVGVFWANQQGQGVHVNVSGAGVVKNAAHKAEAIQLLEWLVSVKAQQKFASLNYEFPVVAGVKLDPLVEAWGPFKGDQTQLSKAGQNQAEAIKLMDRVGYK